MNSSEKLRTKFTIKLKKKTIFGQFLPIFGVKKDYF